MGFVGCIPRFLKSYAGWVLTALGTGGMIATVILVGKETPEADYAIREAEWQHKLEWLRSNDVLPPVHYPEEDVAPEELPKEASLSWWEKTKIAAPIYLPSILAGTGTLACFWGSQIFNARKQAALTAAYGLLLMQFDQYREAIRNEYGDEADKRAFEVSQAEVRRLRGENEKLKKENQPKLYEFASLPGVIFEEKPEKVINALMHFNRNLMLRGSNTLAELYTFTGLPEGCYDQNESAMYGWQTYENEVDYGCSFVDFMFVRKVNRDGRDVQIISSYIPPYEVDVDYGFEGDTSARMYPGYNIELAEECAALSSEKNIQQTKEGWVVLAPQPF